MGQLHHNCGATTIKGIKTTILLVGTTIKGQKQALFLVVPIGNGVRGGITLHKIGGGSAIKVNFIALTLHYLCKRKANGLR